MAAKRLELRRLREEEQKNAADSQDKSDEPGKLRALIGEPAKKNEAWGKDDES